MSPLSMGAMLSRHIAVALLVTYPILTEAVQGQGDRSTEGPAPASDWVNSRTRRALDIAVATIAIILFFPLFVVCWILVRFSSCGPGFFLQDRMGRHGREFTLVKFRTMRTEPCTATASHTVVDDHRITPAGAFLRRYKLDELPQFWNVLKGDMSLVGPRPKLAHHEGLEMPYRPGLTGPATLAFRNEERMLLEVPSHRIDEFYQSVVKPIKASLDREYMESATLWSDVRILWQTLTRCMQSEADARGELCLLIDIYAPGYNGLLSPEVRATRRMPANAILSIVPELTDDLISDLDDAA